jgi:CheY-like chemotaxis protein
MTAELPSWTDLPPRPRRGVAPRILLVDDDPDFLELATAALVGEGFHVATARTAGEAVMSAVREPPDVVLLDIILPGADGIDALDALRAEPETADIPVLACTSLGERDSAALLTRLGFDGLVGKPLDLLALARALREALPARTHE